MSAAITAQVAQQLLLENRCADYCSLEPGAAGRGWANTAPVVSVKLKANSFSSKLIHQVWASIMANGDTTGCFLLPPLAFPALHIAQEFGGVQVMFVALAAAARLGNPSRPLPAWLGLQMCYLKFSSNAPVAYCEERRQQNCSLCVNIVSFSNRM